MFQVVALFLIIVSIARGFPLSGKELDSAVDGVQKYLESSGFPKMTRGEVLDFLNEFSRNSRVSRSDVSSGKNNFVTVSPQPNFTPAMTHSTVKGESASITTPQPNIPNGESPLNYGYPMSVNKPTEQSPESTTKMMFVTPQESKNSTRVEKIDTVLQTIDGRNLPKKSIIPPVDLNAYSKFKKIPEARNLKIDDDMKDFLNNFGLLDPPKTGKSLSPKEPQRRVDDASVTESVDEQLLKSILTETGAGNGNVTDIRPFFDSISKSDHVFNPSDSDVKTVDINRIAKIVENIRLLTDDNNNTVSLPQDVFLKKFENITAAIEAIDQPAETGAGVKPFNGYEVFFDDDSKEVDSDLPESPTGQQATGTLSQAPNPPDPLSADELQQLLEKNKNDVKRQEPSTSTTTTTTTSTTTTAAAVAATSTDEPEAVATSSETVAVSSTSTDSSSEATSAEVTSDSGVARDFSTTAAAPASASASDTNPSLTQLAESFGGGETASDPPTAEDVATTAPPNRPRNGLYFYVDWNSFLTVNAGQKNQVNLRFAPKAGNPAHFIKVTVP